MPSDAGCIRLGGLSCRALNRTINVLPTIIKFGLDSQDSICSANPISEKLELSVKFCIVLYVGMCLTLCNTCFGLINVVPDQVLTWIGGSMSSRIGTDMDDKTKAHHGQAVAQASSHASRVFGRDKSVAGGGGKGMGALPSRNNSSTSIDKGSER